MKKFIVNIIFSVTLITISQFFIIRYIMYNYYSDEILQQIADSLNYVPNPDIINDYNSHNYPEDYPYINNKHHKNTPIIFRETCPDITKPRVKFSIEKFEKIKEREFQKAKKEFIVDILAELTPYDVDKCLIRVGQRYDGGYLILNHELDKVEVVYTYGVNDDTMFERQFTDKYNSKMWLYDFSIKGVPYHPNFNFVKEGVSGSPDKKKLLDTVENHLTKNLHFGKRKILKLDVEGAEYDSIETMKESILLEFDQVIMEIHNVTDNLKRFKLLLDKLNKYFYIYHVHANNFSYTVKSENFRLPRVLEVGWIKKSLINSTDVYFSNKVLPLYLDAPNNSTDKDIKLDYWPFKYEDV